MSTIPTWHARFGGRPIGSIGITRMFEKKVQGVDENDARLAIYDTHEHLSAVTLRRLTVTRYVVTHVNGDGLRTLTFAQQGRETYATVEEAQRVLEVLAPSLREKVLGARADTLEVRACECWEGHFDPVGVFFD